MAPQQSEATLKLFKLMDSGSSLDQAWRLAKKPLSLKRSARRAYENFKRKRDAEEAEIASPEPKSGTEVRGTSTTSRPTATIGQKARKTSHQTSIDTANREAWESEHKQQFKLATLEISELKKAGHLGKAGNTYADIARKYNNELASDNPKEITGTALKDWLRRNPGKAGTSPVPRGKKRDAGMLALEDVTKTWAKLNAAQGDSKRPVELVQVMKEAVEGTEFEDQLAEAHQQRHVRRPHCPRANVTFQNYISTPRPSERG
jgi:hypothetical protein